MPSAYLCVPAYPILPERRDQARQAGLRLAAAAGCTLVESPLLDRLAIPGSWLPEADRRADLHAAADHALVIAARGGYGCLHLLEGLPDLPPVVGFSDLTILHAARWVAGGGGVYGMMPAAAHGPRAMATACALLAGQVVEFGSSQPRQDASEDGLHDVLVLRTGRAAGPGFAACLRVLAGLCGTRFQPALSGCVLCLEDIDEKPYQIDRDLEQLHHAGVLRGIVGLIFGRFPLAVPPGTPAQSGPTHADIARRWVDRLGVPALFGLPFGHDRDPLALPIGGWIDLTAESTDHWRISARGHVGATISRSPKAPSCKESTR